MPTWSTHTILFAAVISCLSPSFAAAADFGNPRNIDAAHTNHHFSSARHHHLDEWRSRRGEIRKQILVSTGLWPRWPRATVEAAFAKPLQRETFRVETVTFETLPGFRLHSNIYRPTREQCLSPAKATWSLPGTGQGTTNPTSFPTPSAIRRGNNCGRFPRSAFRLPVPPESAS